MTGKTWRAALVGLLMAMPAAAAPMPGSMGNPVWDGGDVSEDTLFFIQDEGQPPGAALLFVPDAMPALTSASGETPYQAGKDYQWRPGSRVITLPAGSAIPFNTRAQMYVPEGPGTFGPARGHPGQSALVDGGHMFHDRQVMAAYHSHEAWQGFVPAHTTTLTRTKALLKAGKPIRVAVLGDSISVGWSASSQIKAPPMRPAYPALVADGLKAMGASQVTVTNVSVGGKDSFWGLTQVGDVVAAQPDLAIIAFGMNDAIRVSPADYGANITRIIAGIRAARPDCDIILVASMTGNPEWGLLKMENFPAFRDALKKLEGDGVAVADVTDVWDAVRTRKSFADLTGNGLNHPNDFGHRIYADVILALLR